MHEFLGYSGNLLRHRSGEHKHLSLLRHVSEYLLYIIEESHVEHLVSLIKNDGMHIGEPSPPHAL